MYLNFCVPLGDRMLNWQNVALECHPLQMSRRVVPSFHACVSSSSWTILSYQIVSQLHAVAFLSDTYLTTADLQGSYKQHSKCRNYRGQYLSSETNRKIEETCRLFSANIMVSSISHVTTYQFKVKAYQSVKAYLLNNKECMVQEVTPVIKFPDPSWILDSIIKHPRLWYCCVLIPDDWYIVKNMGVLYFNIWPWWPHTWEVQKTGLFLSRVVRKICNRRLNGPR